MLCHTPEYGVKIELELEKPLPIKVNMGSKESDETSGNVPKVNDMILKIATQSEF